MSLAAGEKLGPYEIVRPIGKGGMGEVYRARDSRLGRDVAIKVSAERFDREARAVAALNHPNISALYDVGPNYLVMELVEGESPKGPLPPDEVLRIMKQIAEALGEAHEKGIVHRDLKPANIKIRPDGTVKVLDFGLAKMSSASAQPAPADDDLPTASLAETAAGVILGTAGYMAPEQARGKPTDKRADIWSFGVVFHELLAGRRTFAGEDMTETLARVLQAEPSWEGIPANVQRLLKKCLEKDPKKRLRDIGDAWELLDAVPAAAPQRSGGRFWPAVAGVLALTLAVILVIRLPWRAEKPPDQPLVRFDMDIGSDVTLEDPGLTAVNAILSPAADRLAYVAHHTHGPVQLFTRRLDQTQATELPGTEGAFSLFFSPDGQWLGFAANGHLNKISVDGGAVVPLAADFPIPFGAAFWADDDSILFAQPGHSLSRILPAGGTPATTTELGPGELAFNFAFPQFLPGGKSLLLDVGTGGTSTQSRVEIATLADQHKKVLVQGGHAGRYLPTFKDSGHLVYSIQSTLFAVPFDPGKLELRGTAVPILDDVAVSPVTGNPQISFSNGGSVLYRRGSTGAGTALSSILSVDQQGKRSRLVSKNAGYTYAPRFSPDGKRLAVAAGDGTSVDIWVHEGERSFKLTITNGPYFAPVWSPDGRYVFFGSNHGIYWSRADVAGQPQRLIESKAITYPSSFSPDGRRFAYIELGESGGRGGRNEIGIVPLQFESGQWKTDKPEKFSGSGRLGGNAMFSPDGKWLAYSSSETGSEEVYVRAAVRPASGGAGQSLISENGGRSPVWSRTNHELLYQSGDRIMAVTYSVTGDHFEAQKPRLWLDKIGSQLWDLAPDGKHLAIIAPAETVEAARQEHTLVYLQNFFDELRRRVR